MQRLTTIMTLFTISFIITSLMSNVLITDPVWNAVAHAEDNKGEDEVAQRPPKPTYFTVYYSEAFSLPSSGFMMQKQECESGTLVGGGYQSTSSNSILNGSYPADNQWWVMITQLEDDGGTMTVNAVCHNPPESKKNN
ncbi:MAG: hypothetical protein HOJ79_05345 [Nitrospina sp.]|jgi:hypothetical protein|nr:hypothetical protein [Nitrospina sp.]